MGGGGTSSPFKGRTAIRGLLEDWVGRYQVVEIEIADILDLGDGVGFVIARMEGQLAESTAHLRVRFGAAYLWADDLIVRVTSHTDIDEARAAAERLSRERADG